MGASSPCSAVLPEGTYQAYVDACFGDDVAMSNVVTFYVAAALPGDLDGDGVLTVTDAVLLQRYLLGADTLTQGQWQVADATQTAWSTGLTWHCCGRSWWDDPICIAGQWADAASISTNKKTEILQKTVDFMKCL